MERIAEAVHILLETGILNENEIHVKLVSTGISPRYHISKCHLHWSLRMTRTWPGCFGAPGRCRVLVQDTEHSDAIVSMCVAIAAAVIITSLRAYVLIIERHTLINTTISMLIN
jgi:hypothetical protein